MTLRSSNGQPLVETAHGLLVDLDGVVQLDIQPVPGAADALDVVRRGGVPVAFVTNNAAREPAEVVQRLRHVGVTAAEAEVVTAAQAAARLVAADLVAGSRVLVVGGPGLWSAVSAAGLVPVATAAENPVAVVQGWGPDVDWALLAEACVALRSGVHWIASNRDLTLPSPRGPLPGSGSLIAALVAATGREPDAVAGKPEPPLFLAARERLGVHDVLMVGDRLDTDVAGANRAGIPALLVLTGVSRARDLLAAAPEQRPAYVGADLRAVTEAHPEVVVAGDAAACRSVTVRADGSIEAAGRADAVDGLRAAAELSWSGRLKPERYGDVLRELGLD